MPAFTRSKERKKLTHWQRFLIFLPAGLLALFVIFALSLRFGATESTWGDVFGALFNYNSDSWAQTTVRDIRLPRFIADLIVGASLSIAGAIMQGTTKNPMADSGIMGISSGSTLGVVVIMAFFPEAGRYEKMGMAALGAAIVTFAIYAIAFLGKRRVSPDRLVLSGMAISTLLASLTSAIILKNGLMTQMVKYTSASSANTVWNDVLIALPFFAAGVLFALIISRQLTVSNLGDDVAKGLGANVVIVRLISTLVVLVLSAVAVVIIGPVSYIGLMIPYIARYMVGTDYRYCLPIAGIYGAFFVSLVDLIARNVMPGVEFPVGLIITVIGVPFFIYVSRRQKGETFDA
ncbi:MAG: iron ABC transporter permease [Bacilli bacterium]|nr:iron ABC transporter permease [Bacilli bacterium]